jgi:WXXGXW repeat (2 copies)
MRRWCSFVGFAVAIIVLAISVTSVSRTAQAQINVDITIAPPELPVYDQPPLPAVGYIWIPGYWAWGLDGYFWVPGYWELPPAVGLLWTPGYWGWHDGIYAWNEGYWGPHIGFYGGVNYGFGYGGNGYLGGHWDHGVFAYNRTVNNFGGVHVTNVYNQTVVVNNVTRVSFNGGTGGIAAQPTQQELAIAHEQHVPPTAAQTQHQQTASANPALRASENHGRPAIVAVSRPNEFSGKGVVAAHEATPANFRQEEKPGGAPGGVGGNPNAARPNPNAAKTLGNHPVLGNNPPPGSNPKPTPPQPHMVSAPNRPVPHPPVPPAPHPPASPHPVAAVHPPAPHPPAPHPQARPAPHPNNKKPT